MKCTACHPPLHTSHYLHVLLPVCDPHAQRHKTEAFSCCQSARAGLWKRADCWQMSHRGPITFSACQERVNPGEEGGGNRTLGSVVTECVINAAMCPVPRTFSTSGPFLRHWKNRRGQQEERGVSGAPLCHCICPERGYRLQLGLRRMTLVNHEVMVDEIGLG